MTVELLLLVISSTFFSCHIVKYFIFVIPQNFFGFFFKCIINIAHGSERSFRQIILDNMVISKNCVMYQFGFDKYKGSSTFDILEIFQPILKQQRFVIWRCNWNFVRIQNVSSFFKKSRFSKFKASKSWLCLKLFVWNIFQVHVIVSEKSLHDWCTKFESF